MRLLNQARRIIIVLNCNFVNCSEATKSSEVVNPSEALNTAATVLLKTLIQHEGKRQFNRFIIYCLNIVPMVNDSF